MSGRVLGRLAALVALFVGAIVIDRQVVRMATETDAAESAPAPPGGALPLAEPLQRRTP